MSCACAGEGLGVGAIARRIGRDKSTVSREARRDMCRAGTTCPHILRGSPLPGEEHGGER